MLREIKRELVTCCTNIHVPGKGCQLMLNM